MPITISNLNESQRKAFDWNERPILVLAGPGSGKTAVLALRIANLIDNTPDDNFRILGLTFTVKAANEMQNRIRELIGEDSKRIQLRTFHSFCVDILRQHGSQLGLRPDFQVITDEKDRIAVLNEVNGTGIEIDDSFDSLKKIDTMFVNGITPDDLPKYFKSGNEDQCTALQIVFRKYINSLIGENQLDFGSMLHLTCQLLESKSRIAKQVRTVYKYVCIDEFQDTNRGQYKLLRLLCPDSDSNLFVVADDDQIIYQWNGASPKRLANLKRDYVPQVIQLPENYRCPTEVVEIANRLILNNSKRISSKMDSVSHQSEEGSVRLKSFCNFEDELNGLASEIEPISKNCREGCLVIARSNKLLMQAKEKMTAKGVKSEIIRKQQEFASPPIQLMYHSMKLANSPESRSLLSKLCSSARLVYGSVISAEDVVTLAGVEGNTLLRAFFLIAAKDSQITQLATKGIELLCDSLDYRTYVSFALQQFDSLNQSDSNGDVFPDYSTDKTKWHQIERQINNMHGSGISLHAYLQTMDMSPKEELPPRDCIRLQTVHTAKGTEFENVFIIGMAEDQFPTYFAVKNGDLSIEEERRNCFVAVTRSSKNLYLSYASSYFGWNKEPSRFLREMGLID